MHRTYESLDVPAWPVYTLTVHGDGRVDAVGPLVPLSRHTGRASAVAAVAGSAARLGRPVRAVATEPDGTVWHLVVSPDGGVGELTGRGEGAGAPKRHNRPPAAVTPAPAPAPELPTYTDTLALVTAYLEAGRVGAAASLAARTDEAVADALGVSHPDALRIRELRARTTALAGDPAGGVWLYRDIAERWLYQGEHAAAEAAAHQAETLWRRITDVPTALSAGVAVIRMRNQIPGDGGTALAVAREHQAWLTAAQTSAGPF
ncbi:hypothetical protein [Streptomyces sp. NPDC047061]|uniref:hypothetical protein n=1 Tax=Streptomyces sp. NPDC047061 TaxID=3154605 RepID=UPI0033D496AF